MELKDLEQTVLLKEERAGEFIPPDFKTCREVIVIKTVQYWSEDRQVDQWNRIQPRNRLTCQLTFQKVPKPFSGRNDSFFHKWSWDKCIKLGREESLLTAPTAHNAHTINVRWVTDSDAKPKYKVLVYQYRQIPLRPWGRKRFPREDTKNTNC